ncbi:Immunity protein 22 [Paenibacillus algorifonticola]|uniref:Immunity protein 22 n=1 Tax=Paenibacillus algorifonticola TaxID=684063 RepID=A0A1I2J6A8_9BACL|nr:immunity 22 family protein [Paenibacillus algorifonticola]SFF50312.1 Immunity protein 22 [Paenibacillus algorifonticola]
MDSPGAVSLWFGKCNSEEKMREYLEVKFDEHGDRIKSTFMNDFNIDFIDYNQDLLEFTYLESPTTSITELLKRASYSEIMINELVDFYGDKLMEKCNIAIRLYDYDYEESVEEVLFEGKKIEFIGSVNYE